MQRPGWARWLDALALSAAGVLRLVWRRPSEAVLHKLAGRESRQEIVHTSATAGAADQLQKGRAALEKGAMGEALHHFGQAVQLNPEARWAWHGRGDALQLMGEYKDAEAAYAMAVSLEPECGLHHAGRSNALRGLGRLDEAAEIWNQALRLDPDLEWMRQD